MCLKKTHCTFVQHNNRRKTSKMNSNYQKEVQTKLTKGLLGMIILQYLEQQSMHGYQLITKIRKGFGVYFGPSTVYPLVNSNAMSEMWLSLCISLCSYHSLPLVFRK